MSTQFITHLLTRNDRIESDLIDQLFNSTEKRLARALLLLAGYGTNSPPALVVPRMPQAALADMIGTTRSRINFFLVKFKKLGYISYRGAQPVTINRSLVTVLLHDEKPPDQKPTQRRTASVRPTQAKRRR
jgi:CRP/FNR family cyclic AMP-dependent transcriptional regulator